MNTDIPTQIRGILSLLNPNTASPYTTHKNVTAAPEDSANSREIVEPEPGSYWRGSIDERVYQVAGVVSDREARRYVIFHDSLDNPYMILLREWEQPLFIENNLLRTENPRLFSGDPYTWGDEDQIEEPGTVARFVLTTKSKDFRWYWHRTQNLRNWWTKITSGVLSIDQTISLLEKKKVKEFWVMNVAQTAQGVPEFLINQTYENNRPGALKIHASWIPVNLLTQFPLDYVSKNVDLRKLFHAQPRMVAVLHPWKAKQIIANAKARETIKADAARAKFVKDTGSARGIK